MRADVLDDVDAAAAVAHHDHRPLADRRSLEVAGVGDFRFEADARGEPTPVMAARR
jgi:phage-related baseplate assembly protein